MLPACICVYAYDSTCVYCCQDLAQDGSWGEGWCWTSVSYTKQKQCCCVCARLQACNMCIYAAAMAACGYSQLLQARQGAPLHWEVACEAVAFQVAEAGKGMCATSVTALCTW